MADNTTSTRTAADEAPELAPESAAFRPDIEGLRGVAIALVVLYHAGLALSGGFIGVDVFFVVSGFLITGLLLRDRERHGAIRFATFYARRIRRLLPAALLVGLVTLVAADRLLSPLDRPAVSLDGAAAALSVANIRFAITTDYFSPVGTPSPFLHFWSLGVEEQFYLVWPALLALAALWRPRLGAAVILIVIFVGSLAASVLVTEQSPSSAFYLLPTRAWQLAAGGLLAVGAVGVGSLARVPRFLLQVGRILLALGAWTALGVIGAVAVVLDSSTPYPGLVALVPTLAAVVLIAGGGLPFGPGVLLRTPPIRFLGRISYSLYLWHWPVLVLGALVIGGTLTLGQTVGLVGVAGVLAIGTWAFVEEPFRRGRLSLPSMPRATVAAGLAAILVVALIGNGFAAAQDASLENLGGAADLGPSQSVPVATGRPAGPGSSSAAATSPTSSNGTGSLVGSAGPTARPTGTGVPQTTPAQSPFRLTSAVRPSLIDARTDYERTWLDGCLGSLTTTVPHDCRYGNKGGAFTVALVGDSHASALFPAVQAVANAHGWRLVTFVKVSCQFFDMPIYSVMLKREYTECATWNQNVVARLNAIKPNLVLVSNSRWVFPLNAADKSRAKEGAALARMIEKLSSRVVIIDDVPLPYIDVPACLAAHASDVRQCAVPRSQDLGDGMGLIEKTAAAATGASRIDLTAGICPGAGACPVVINDMIVYRDGHHLTATFSRTLAPLLDRRLRALGIT